MARLPLAFRHCVHIIRVDVDIEGQKRVHAGRGPKFTLYSSQEGLCLVDIVFAPKESAQRPREVVE